MSIALLAACGGDEPTDGVNLGETAQEVVVGAIAARSDNIVRGGGVVVVGASLAGREDGATNASADLSVAGIPVGATVARATLYWAISGGSDTTATINSIAVTGAAIGTAGSTCWTAANNFGFRADVTARVTGNGLYTIGGLPSSASDAAADTDGVALVVEYTQATSGTRRRIMVRDGLVSTSGTGDIVTDTFTGVAAPFATTGRFHLIVGDGQTAADGTLSFNGGSLGASQFSGSSGSLWDVRTYNVTVPATTANLAWSSTSSSDCLLFETAVLEYNVAVCGDGLRTGGEACEQGNVANGDGCSSTCDLEPGWNCTGTPSVCTTICGDGIRTGAEQCDQGNVANGDGCSSTCQIEPGWTCTGSPSTCSTVCGDGVRAGAEQCDQGNTTPGDGCSATCTIEPGWTCTGSPSTCTTRCGDGIRAGAEQCDQGNTTPGDGCSATCTVERGWTCNTATPNVCTTTCGDGIIAGAEVCDDGDGAGGDGCSAACTVETGWTCAGEPSSCATTCGDGIIAGAETCDDGGTAAGDGCSAACAVEPGWTCVGAPSSCDEVCGDGQIVGAEACDDGDATGGDGCSATCTVEAGWTCAGAPSTCVTTCGDGIIAGAETCDDGDREGGDGCAATCQTEEGWYCVDQPSECSTICGDGLVRGAEACDDGNTAADDGCSTTCTIERGWSCAGEPSTCMTGCGDGIVAGTETCDDGNTAAADGCSAACAIEDGWNCDGAPSVCTTECGDGLVVGAETCDDDNATGGDGCSPTCQVEDGWLCEGAPSACTELSVAGGGCSTGGPGGLALVGALLALALAAPRPRRAGRVAGLALLGGLAVTGAGAAQAQVVTGSSSYPAERFRLAMDRAGVLDVEAARTPGHLAVDVGVWMGYANDPLTVRLGADGERLGALVSDRIGGDLVASLGLGRRFALGLAAPLIVSQSAALGPLMTGAGSLDSLGLGDLALTPKAMLVDGGVTVALAATVTVPTSSADDAYFGDDGLTVAPALLIGRDRGALRILANLGYRVRSEQRMLDLAIDDELFARLGLGLRAGRADLMAEVAFATAAAAPLDDYNGNHAEARAGVGLDVMPGLRLFAAGGAGLASGFGTPDWRALGGLWFGTARPATGGPAGPRDTDRDGIYDETDRCPTNPETMNGWEDQDGCPDELDADGDGVPLPADQCPDGRETKNGFQDDDGCADTVPDSDGDGLSDPTDACPDQPEDRDDFDDDDGCPDPDNDGDTVVDASDRCPLEVGVPDNGGCPDTDRDGDTVVDRADNCPDEPGSVKNFGCKDKQLVVFKGSTIELLDVVYFKTNKAIIEKRSFKLLRAVATVIRAHPEIKRITVEGHTDDQGDDTYNKDLSQRRAQAVVDFLVGTGVDGALLVPIGYGEERPLADNRTRKGRATNRRVEFKVEGVVGNVIDEKSGPTEDTMLP